MDACPWQDVSLAGCILGRMYPWQDVSLAGCTPGRTEYQIVACEKLLRSGIRHFVTEYL